MGSSRSVIGRANYTQPIGTGDRANCFARHSSSLWASFCARRAQTTGTRSDLELTQHEIGRRELVEIPARTSDEPRWLLIGKIDGKHWSAIITRRGENIRFISVRRSRDEEVELYESENL
jgi:hypothetical protein